MKAVRWNVRFKKGWNGRLWIAEFPAGHLKFSLQGFAISKEIQSELIYSKNRIRKSFSLKLVLGQREGFALLRSLHTAEEVVVDSVCHNVCLFSAIDVLAGFYESLFYFTQVAENVEVESVLLWFQNFRGFLEKEVFYSLLKETSVGRSDIKEACKAVLQANRLALTPDNNAGAEGFALIERSSGKKLMECLENDSFVLSRLVDLKAFFANLNKTLEEVVLTHLDNKEESDDKSGEDLQRGFASQRSFGL